MDSSRGPSRRPGREEHFAFAKIEPRSADMAAGGGRLAHRDHAIAGLGILLDEDRVGALGHRRAGEDARGFARADLAVKPFASDRRADEPQPRAGLGVGGAHRVAIHRGGGEGRLGTPGGQRRGKHAVDRLRERHGLGLRSA